jgi:hypothetical protein
MTFVEHCKPVLQLELAANQPEGVVTMWECGPSIFRSYFFKTGQKSGFLQKTLQICKCRQLSFNTPCRPTLCGSTRDVFVGFCSVDSFGKSCTWCFMKATINSYDGVVTV